MEENVVSAAAVSRAKRRGVGIGVILIIIDILAASSLAIRYGLASGGAFCLLTFIIYEYCDGRGNRQSPNPERAALTRFAFAVHTGVYVGCIFIIGLLVLLLM